MVTNASETRRPLPKICLVRPEHLPPRTFPVFPGRRAKRNSTSHRAVYFGKRISLRWSAAVGSPPYDCSASVISIPQKEYISRDTCKSIDSAELAIDPIRGRVESIEAVWQSCSQRDKSHVVDRRDGMVLARVLAR